MQQFRPVPFIILPGQSGRKPHTTVTARSSNNNKTRLDVESLDSAVEFYFCNGLSPSTRKSYASGKRRYLMFCREKNCSPTISHHLPGLLRFGITPKGLQCTVLLSAACTSITRPASSSASRYSSTTAGCSDAEKRFTHPFRDWFRVKTDSESPLNASEDILSKVLIGVVIQSCQPCFQLQWCHHF